MEITQLNEIGNKAVRRLRMQKLRSGRPFMINSNELSGKKCYLEYPDGRIHLVTISDSTQDFVSLRELSAEESAKLRAKYHLDSF